MSQTGNLNFTADDLKRPGWAVSIMLGTLRKIPDGMSMSVLSHIDSMVEEGANEALREFGCVETLGEMLASNNAESIQLAMVAIDSSLWKFTYEFKGFLELYECARSSLVDQQFGVLSQLAHGAMERLSQLETMLPAPLANSLTARLEAISNNKIVSSFFQEFHGQMTSIAALARDVEEYSAESAHFIRDFVRDRFAFSGWFALAQSAFDRPRDEKTFRNQTISM